MSEELRDLYREMILVVGGLTYWAWRGSGLRVEIRFPEGHGLKPDRGPIAVTGADANPSEDVFVLPASLLQERMWALDRMERCVAGLDAAPAELTRRLLREAVAIEEEDRQMCYAIGRAGADLIREGSGVKLYIAYLRDPDGNKLCALHRVRE